MDKETSFTAWQSIKPKWEMSLYNKTFILGKDLKVNAGGFKISWKQIQTLQLLSIPSELQQCIAKPARSLSVPCHSP